MHNFSLKEAFNRYLDDGVHVYTKRSVEAYGMGDWPRIEACLEEWQARGLVKIVKPLSSASEDEIVVEVFDFIDRRKA